MADEESSDNATVQMSVEQVKRLHAELAAASAKSAGKSAAAVQAAAESEDYPEEAYATSEEDFTEEPAAEEYADEPVEVHEPTVDVYEPEPVVKNPKLDKKPKLEKAAPPPKVEKAAKPAPAPKPAKPAPAPKPARESAPSQGGGGLLIVGGIGAIVAGLSVCLPILGQIQGMTGDPWPILGGTIGMALGHLLVALGMFGAVSRTNGVAALVGTLHILAMAGLAFFLLAAFRVVELDGDLVRYVMLAPAILPGTAWLLSGIWGFASGTGAIGVLHGVFSLLGGGAMIGLTVGALAGAFSGDDDMAIALGFGGPGLILIGSIFLAIAMFGRLRRPAA